MTPLDIGREIAEHCRRGDNVAAIEKFYSPTVVSVEPMEMPEMPGIPAMPAEMRGIDTVLGKNRWWIDNHEVHSVEVSGPHVHGDRFILQFAIDVTPKVGPGAGHRMQMVEAGLYQVENGKITREEFFYVPPEC